MNSRAAAAIVAMLFSTSAMGDGNQFANGQAVSLQPDKAYVLVRTIGKSCGFANIACFRMVPFLIRTLSNEELGQASALAREDPDHWRDRVESNVVEPLPDQPYAEQGEEEFLLLSLKPGTYVLGGMAGAEHGPGVILTSLCMGTVKFEAKPGAITDLGTILWALDDRPTTIPELSAYVTGKPVGNGPNGVAAAIRPATSTTEVPETLVSLPRVAADYWAVLPTPNYLGAALGRLAPLAGVLAYDKDGHVIDLKSGQSTSH